MLPADLQAQVDAWLADDPDERDRAELTALAADDSPAAREELADRFGGRLEFGTAGLRGAVAAGPSRMNRAVVRGTTAALARWLLGRRRDAAQAGVVIGCDARHRSDEFAEEAAAVLAGAGLQVHMLPKRQPTPLLAFAVRHLSAAAGIMITASHNPPADNGYKLYLGDGAQIIPPADAEIEAAIGRVGPLAQIPLAAADSPLISRPGDEIARAYLDAVCAVSPAPSGAAWLRFVYTPLHGVAAAIALRAFEQAGFTEPDLVTAQAEPDPDFPTVAFPNPEEPGALDLALAQARRSGADLVIANDPDGDRLAVAVPDPEVTGGWRTLTGDQVGALLGSYLLDRTRSDPQPENRLVVTTIVSSRCCPASRRRPARNTPGLSPDSSGSSERASTARIPVSSWVMRRLSDTRSVTWSGTRTGSVPRWPCWAWPRRPGPRGNRCRTPTMRWRPSTACT